MKILITGAAGFIASHIADAYLKLGHQVVVVDNLSSGFKKNIPAKAVFYEQDITDSKLADIIAKEKPDIVNHHAAQINVRTSVENPMADARINILGALNLFEACRKNNVQKIIFASTGGAIYGDDSPIPTDESAKTEPKSPYGIAKLSIEKYLQFYFLTYNLPSVILRYANVYGPRQNAHGEAGVVSIFTEKLLKNEIPTIYGDGKQTRDYVFVDDVVAANVAALTENRGIYNVGTGVETDVVALADKIIKLIGKNLTPKYVPARAGEQLRSCLKPGKLQKNIRNIDAGLAKTVDWFTKHSTS